MKELWAICTHFNYCGYESLYNNYIRFSDAMKRQNVNLLTVELAFEDKPYRIPESHNVLRMRANSVLWQKERMINYAIETLPSSCKYVAWLDADILLKEDKWPEMAAEELKSSQLIQLFDRAWYLPSGHYDIPVSHKDVPSAIGLMNQYKNNTEGFIHKKFTKTIPFAHAGYAWAAERSWLNDVDGIFDRNVVGANDVHFIDGCLQTYELHRHSPSTYYDNNGCAFAGYLHNYMNMMKKHMPRPGFIKGNVYSMNHGDMKNKKYVERKYVLTGENFNPETDIKLINNVYEWCSEKPNLHAAVKAYFSNRQEDD